MKKVLALLLALLMTSTLFTATAFAADVVEVEFANVWKSTSRNFPDDLSSTAMGKLMEEKFGLKLKMTDTGSRTEVEFLNMLFSGGILPDVANNAYWGAYAGGEGAAVIQAAKEGLMKDIAPYLADYPNLQALVNNLPNTVSKAMSVNLFHNAEYPEGAVYFLPNNLNTNSAEYSSVFGDTLYIRKDVAEALELNIEDIKTMDDVYELCKKIAASGITDWNGNPIIPISTLEFGWRADNIYGWLRGNTMSDYRQLEDGTVVHVAFTDYYKDRVMFMRKLFSEGLMDIECLDMTLDTSRAKQTQGRFAIITCDANNAVGELYATGLVDAHPEAEWIPLYAMNNQDGNNTVDVYNPGFSSGHIMWFAYDIEDEQLRAVLSLMEWLCTEEGKLFARYGVEGEHYIMENGLPVETESWIAAKAADPDAVRNSFLGKDLGIQNYLMVEDNYDTLWPIPMDQLDARTASVKKLENYFRPRVEVNAISVADLLATWEDYDMYNDSLQSIGIEDMLKQAYFYATEEEVDAVIQTIRDNLTKIGVEDACKFIQENLSENYAF